RPAEGLTAPAGIKGPTDHDRAVGVHAGGIAKVASRQKAEADHAARCRPAEGFRRDNAGEVGAIAKTDHDRAVGAHASGRAGVAAKSRDTGRNIRGEKLRVWQ